MNHLLMMKPDNLIKCENGTKTETRRTNKMWAKIKKGDHLYFRSNYKTTYKTASGPYESTADARWENLQDISEQDAIAEGVKGVEGLYNPGRWEFRHLWESIYKKVGERWEDNPMVLKISFKKL